MVLATHTDAIVDCIICHHIFYGKKEWLNKNGY